ncbi:MAG: undecaprenyl-diphosphate phosphatase [Firmicutes bacterium]|nr:undecaprenyl-diphosphate phosphatase [Bacillota bacterium]
MTWLEGIILGLFQGLTEFLPVSSSGHLVIGQALLGIQAPGVIFEVLVHLATTLSIIVVFRRDLSELFGAVFGRGARTDPSRIRGRRLLVLIIVGSIPTAAIGLLLEPLFLSLFESTWAVGWLLLVTGLVLWLADRLPAGRKPLEDASLADALFVGVAQGLAIAPGLSRSGLTVAGTLARGIRPEDAARFSFLLALPAVLGANLLEFSRLLDSPPGPDAFTVAPFLAAMLVAFLSGVWAIRTFLGAIRRRRLAVFSYYTWVVGLSVLFWEGLASLL